MGETELETIAGTTTAKDGSRRLIAKRGGRKDGDWAQRMNLGAGSWSSSENPDKSIEDSKTQLENFDSEDASAPPSLEEVDELITELRSEMELAAKSLDFEQAARLRDRIHELEQWKGR